jgi:hypothetical protein
VPSGEDFYEVRVAVTVCANEAVVQTLGAVEQKASLASGCLVAPQCPRGKGQNTGTFALQKPWPLSEKA